MFGPQPVVLFGEVMEEACHWGCALRVYCVAQALSLRVCYVDGV